MPLTEIELVRLTCQIINLDGRDAPEARSVKSKGESTAAGKEVNCSEVPALAGRVEFFRYQEVVVHSGSRSWASGRTLGGGCDEVVPFSALVSASHFVVRPVESAHLWTSRQSQMSAVLSVATGSGKSA